MGRWDDVTAFKDKDRDDDSGKTDIMFNAPGQGGEHGHVVQSEGEDGQTDYHYVRDNEGTPYVDDSKHDGSAKQLIGPLLPKLVKSLGFLYPHL